MEDDIQFYIDHTKEQMEKTVNHTAQELSKIRAGKAMPSLLEGLSVEYYGNPTPINQVASVSTPDARSIIVKPWEKGMIQEIEKAIINSDLGLTPQNDGEVVRINIPPLTEERRIMLVKQAKTEVENGRISLRSIRKESNDAVKKIDHVSEDLIKDAENENQKLTDSHNAKIDSILEAKEKDIMTI